MNRRSYFIIIAALLFVVSINAIAEETTLRVMTYNIHHARGMDDKVDVDRIAKVILDAKADVVGLQEVDLGVERTDRIDIPALLAEKTGMSVVFEKNIDYQGGQYGNATLSRFPILRSSNHHYMMLREGEQRGLLQVVINVHGKELVFLNTHLDYRKDDSERWTGVAEILRVVTTYKGMPAILVGDMNTNPTTRVYDRLLENWVDIWKEVGKGTGFTYSSVEPSSRIDYIMIEKESPLKPKSAKVMPSTASDHMGLVAEFVFE